MIKTTNSVLSNQTLQMVLIKIGQSQVQSKLAYKIKKFLDAINTEMTRVSKEYREEIGKKFGDLDEKGKIVFEPNPFGFKLKEGTNPEEVTQAIDAFNKKEVTLERDPLTLTDLVDIKISAAEFLAMDAFIADPAEMEMVHDKITHLKR